MLILDILQIIILLPEVLIYNLFFEENAYINSSWLTLSFSVVKRESQIGLMNPYRCFGPGFLGQAKSRLLASV
jgi:hypothetical protein